MRLDGILMNFNYADVSRLPSYLSHVRAKKELFLPSKLPREADKEEKKGAAGEWRVNNAGLMKS